MVVVEASIFVLQWLVPPLLLFSYSPLLSIVVVVDVLLVVDVVAFQTAHAYLHLFLWVMCG